MATEPRPITPNEAFALGTLHGILMDAEIEIDYPFDVNNRYIDVAGLVPSKQLGADGPVMRITIEEVQ